MCVYRREGVELDKDGVVYVSFLCLFSWFRFNIHNGIVQSIFCNELVDSQIMMPLQKLNVMTFNWFNRLIGVSMITDCSRLDCID